MMAAAWLATARRLHAGDGVVLIVLAALSTRSHEVFAYLGPLLAAMTVWTVRRGPMRPSLAVATYLAAAALFRDRAPISGGFLIKGRAGFQIFPQPALVFGDSLR